MSGRTLPEPMPLTRRSGSLPLPAPLHQPRIRRSPCCHSWAASQLLQGSSFLSVVMSVSPSFPGAFLSSGRRWESSGFALPRLPRLSCSCSRGLRSLQHSSWAPKCSCERPASAGGPLPRLERGACVARPPVSPLYRPQEKAQAPVGVPGSSAGTCSGTFTHPVSSVSRAPKSPWGLRAHFGLHSTISHVGPVQ